MPRSGTIVAMLVALVASSLIACVAADPNATAAGLCADPSWTDTQPNIEGEVYNLIGLVQDLGLYVVNISDYSSPFEWEYAMNHTKVLLITENEANKKRGGTVIDDIGTATRDKVIEWINTQYGRIILFYANTANNNFFLDYSAPDKRSADVPDSTNNNNNVVRGLPSSSAYLKTAEAANLTLFASAPDQVESNDACAPRDIRGYIDAFGSNFTCLYGTNDSCAAWMYATGNGHYFGVCVDYYDSKPRGAQDGGWVNVLSRMINLSSSSSRLANWITALLHLVSSFLY